MYGADGGSRTHTPRGNTILSRARLPVPPHRHVKINNKKIIVDIVTLVKLFQCRGPDSNRHGSHLPQDFKSCASANSATPAKYCFNGGGTRIRTGGKGFADLCLTTWLCRHLSGRRDSNPRPPPWQGGVLPLNYFRNWLG